MWQQDKKFPSFPFETYKQLSERLKKFNTPLKYILELWIKNWFSFIYYKIFYTHWKSEKGFYHNQPRFWRYSIDDLSDLGIWSFGKWEWKDLSFFKTKIGKINIEECFNRIKNFIYAPSNQS